MIEAAGVFERFGATGLVPVVVIDRAADAAPLAAALVDGGVACVEITFRTAAAEEAISLLSGGYPDLLLGAGTILSVQQADQAVKAGAQFIVSPGLDEDIVRWCLGQGVAIVPGVATATEIARARRLGTSTVKLFPAEALGGVGTVKALAGPFPDIRFIPSGGVTALNLAGYLGEPAVLACSGSWFVDRKLIAAGEFTEISRRTREALAIVHGVRPPRGGAPAH